MTHKTLWVSILVHAEYFSSNLQLPIVDCPNWSWSSVGKGGITSRVSLLVLSKSKGFPLIFQLLSYFPSIRHLWQCFRMKALFLRCPIVDVLFQTHAMLRRELWPLESSRICLGFYGFKDSKSDYLISPPFMSFCSSTSLLPGRGAST